MDLLLLLSIPVVAEENDEDEAKEAYGAESTPDSAAASASAVYPCGRGVGDKSRG
jgi:hypothetical protein